jgi:hypothetical protein
VLTRTGHCFFYALRLPFAVIPIRAAAANSRRRSTRNLSSFLASPLFHVVIPSRLALRALLIEESLFVFGVALVLRCHPERPFCAIR